MNDPLGILRSLYPQARVTSTRRDPNSALGRANPRSYHNIGQAFDVAPIPGVAFGDYVNRLKSGGVNVVEALDEASNPKPWTTGPNWHIAYGGAPVAAPQRKPKTLADLGDFTQPSPVSFGAPSPMDQAPMTLADLQSPQVAPKSHKTEHTLGNIAGILGDALMAYGGLSPQFGPMVTREREQEADRGFDREKLNAMLEAKRQEALLKAQEPPQFAQNADYFNRLPPEQKRAVLQYQDAVNPVNVSTPQGTQNVPRTTVKRLGNKTYYSIGGEWYEESE